MVFLSPCKELFICLCLRIGLFLHLAKVVFGYFTICRYFAGICCIQRILLLVFEEDHEEDFTILAVITILISSIDRSLGTFTTGAAVSVASSIVGVTAVSSVSSGRCSAIRIVRLSNGAGTTISSGSSIALFGAAAISCISTGNGAAVVIDLSAAAVDTGAAISTCATGIGIVLTGCIATVSGISTGDGSSVNDYIFIGLDTGTAISAVTRSTCCGIRALTAVSA